MKTITLNEAELKICEWLAKNRYLKNRKETVKDNKIGPQSCDVTDLDGICGEFAFCKAMNLYPDMSIYPRSGGHDILINGKRVDVKTTRYKSGKLLATKNKTIADSDIYVLIVSNSPKYTIAGFCNASDLIKDDNLVDLGYGLTYAIDQSKLISLQDFLDNC